ncbi:MAG: pseudouridine synthase [Gemmatimonadota bacterium]
MPSRSPRQHPRPVREAATRGTVSLARALSKLGICSRSQGEQAVRDGRVRVNGRRVTDASLRVVPETDQITLDESIVSAPERAYVMLNKPRGVLTTRHDPRGRLTVYAHLTDDTLPFLGPVGRLDQASEGLLLLTNDTQWGNAISAPASHVRKTYHVQVDRVPDDTLLDQLRHGVTTADGEDLGVARVELLRAGERHGWLLVELDEGRNRQIRRMLQGCGVEVLRLVRVAIGPLSLGSLAKGAWRHLSAAEVAAMATVAGRPPTRSAHRARDGAVPSRAE